MISNHMTGFAITRSPFRDRSSDAAAHDTPPRLTGVLGLALRRLDARLERRHEIVDRGRWCGLRAVLASLARGLRPQELEQLLAIRIGMPLGHPLRGQRADQLLRRFQLALR